MKKAKVYIEFPRTGLGNMLLVWARGVVFAQINDFSLVMSSWGKVQWGAWIRWERKKRAYWGYFKESTWLERARVALQKRTFQIVREPVVENLHQEPAGNTLFIFDQVSPQKDLFGPFRDHRLLIRESLYNLLSERITEKLNHYEAPVIAVHIRRGDFKFGNPITPTDFFIDAIRLARSVSGRELPVTVFTDASPAEIKEVLELPAVRLAEDKPDILDILLMSKSRLLVTSQSSTFSYWAAFLSEAIIIKPEGDWQENVRPADINRILFEGKVNFQNIELVEKLKDSLRAHQW